MADAAIRNQEGSGTGSSGRDPARQRASHPHLPQRPAVLWRCKLCRAAPVPRFYRCDTGL